jgi:quercetin 2,3-dioxygenase
MQVRTSCSQVILPLRRTPKSAMVKHTDRKAVSTKTELERTAIMQGLVELQEKSGVRPKGIARYMPLDNSRYHEYYTGRVLEAKMINIRKSNERGHADHGWLNTRFTFSFADYYDPKHIEFRTLRVMNDDRVAGGGGFPTHPHRDMEIVTYVLEGALQHKDSMGNGSVIKPGDVQYMSAGTGVAHSEFNASETEPVHLYQIWMFPDKNGYKPAYEQKNFSEAEKRGKLRLVVSQDGRDGSVKIRQDNQLYATVLGAGDTVKHALKPERHAFVQVARGSVTLNGKTLETGDGAEISDEKALELKGVKEAEVLLFDLM